MPVIDEAGVIPAFEDYYALFPGDRQPLLFESGPRQKLARPVIKNGPRNHYVGYFASRKNNCQIPFESAIERDACLLFEGWPSVLRYISQPAEITYKLNGRPRRTFPDFELIFRDRRLYVEVKPYAKTQTAAFKNRVAAIRATGELDGRTYHVLTDADIRGAELPQIASLYQQARWKVPPRLTKMVAGWLSQLADSVHYEDAVWRLREYPTARCALDGLILDGVICMDLSIPLARQPLMPTPALVDERREVRA